MASGILGILSYLNRNKDAESELARSIKEIDARKAADIAVEQARADALRRSRDIEETDKQHELFLAFKAQAVSDLKRTGMTQAEAESASDQMAQAKLMAYIRSKPSEQIATSGAVAAEDIRRQKMAEGATGGAFDAGKAGTEAQIGGFLQRAAEAALGRKTATDRLQSAPDAAVAEDIAKAAEANLGTIKSAAALPRVSRATTSAMGRQIAGDTFQTKQLEAADPVMAAKAEDFKNAAEIAKSGLVVGSGGIEMAPVPVSPSANDTQDIYSRMGMRGLEAVGNNRRELKSLLDQLQQIRQANAPAPVGSALPARFNIKDLNQ